MKSGKNLSNMDQIDQRIFILIDLLKSRGDLRYSTEFCEAIGIRKQNLYNIKQEKNNFTTEHIFKIIKNYKVNANWIFGISDEIFINNMTTKKSKAETIS